MSQYLQMDPVKRDYVVVNGSPVPSDRILEQAYFALAIPKNNWLYGGADQGSLLYQLEGVKRSTSIEQQFASFAKDAIDLQLIQTGKASAVSVANIATSTTGTSNQVNIVPQTTQTSSQLNFNSV